MDRTPLTRIRRRAFTLVETMVFVTIAVILIVVAWRVLNRGIGIGRTAVEGIALQQGIRNLMENLTRDVNGSVLILTPNGESPFPDPNQTINIQLIQSATEDPGERAAYEWSDDGTARTNNETPYPFGKTTEDTNYGLPVFQVIYQYDRTTRVVSRGIRSGTLQYTVETSDPTKMSYKFIADTGNDRRAVRRPPTVMVRNVETFEVAPLALDYSELEPLTGRPKMVLTSTLPGEGAQMYRTIGLALRVKADFREDATDVPMAKDSSMEILTKVFSYPKIADMQYGAFFSSIDNDLRY